MSLNVLDATERRCPRCASTEYGPLDLGWPFGDPQHNPNPHASDVVWVCIDCHYIVDSLGPLT